MILPAGLLLYSEAFADHVIKTFPLGFDPFRAARVML